LLRRGDRIDGRFEVEVLIGQGGLAEVYRVRHLELGSTHALKLLVWRRESLENRMVLEGRIQAQLRHPNVVAVTDLIRHEGRIGLLMEYVDHLTLDAYLKQHGALPMDESLELFAAILAGVTAAHDAGVLHRDLKPANVLLARVSRGLVPKVTDFGIAKVVKEDLGASATATGVAMGTPGYLAPEQVLDSADVDARADVFALGAILYELLAGRRAFADAEGEVAARATLENQAVPIDSLVPGCPLHVSRALTRALARRREDRFPDCREFARAVYADRPDLLMLVEGQQVAGPLTLHPHELPAPEVSRQSTSEVTLDPISRTDELLEEGIEAVAPEGPVGVARVTQSASSRPPPGPPRPWFLIGVIVAGLFLAGGLIFAIAQTSWTAVQEDAVALEGLWVGTADGKPFEVRFEGVDGWQVEAVASYRDQGSWVIVPMTGTFDPLGSRLDLTAAGGEVIYRGEVDGPRIQGTYRRRGQRDELPWEVVRQ